VNTSAPELDDDGFLDAFRSGNLPLSAFTHEAHIRLGWIHLTRESLEVAIDSVSQEIRNFVAVHGKEDKYHHTLTVAALHVMASRLGSAENRSFRSFIDRNPDLLSDLKGLIRQHYSAERLASPEAAATWLQPDLRPF
jgi:hypothetical protein